MTTFFTSDHHIGHANILRFCAETRPHDSLDAMHQAYIDAWNAVVGPTDTVRYLGDLSMKFPPGAQFLTRVKGVKHLVAGNHDKCFGLQPQQSRQYLDAGFATVRRHDVLELQGLRFAVCHFPYRAPDFDTSTDPKTVALRTKYAPLPLAAGAAGEVGLIHGHVHQHWRARLGAAGLPELNVGVDAWAGRPVSEDELVALYHETRRQSGPALMDHQGRWQTASSCEHVPRGEHVPAGEQAAAPAAS